MSNYKKTNPFTIAFGQHPTQYIQRFEDTEKVISVFSSPSPAAHVIV